jgi:hypothetical protein
MELVVISIRYFNKKERQVNQQSGKNKWMKQKLIGKVDKCKQQNIRTRPCKIGTF